jgi:electron transport complex protein RnfG
MMTNKDIAKIAFNLIVVYVVGGMLLAGMYIYTSPIIYQNTVVAGKQAALLKILPEAESIKKAGDWTIHEHHAEYYRAKKGKATVGYIIESYGKGYSSLIHVLIATDTNLAITRISILSHAETPGLGDEIEKDYFRNQFIGKKAAAMKVLKESTTENIQAITGVTISSRAVTEDAVKNALEFLTKAQQGAVAHGAH